MAKLRIETVLDTKDFTKQIEIVKKETQEAYDYLNHLNKLKFDGKGFAGIDREINEAEIKARNLNNQLITLQERQKKINEQSKEDKGIGFEKGLNSLKKFALGLFGIRTAFSALRRATNAYLAENETTANKMNAIWVALGNALGPVIEIIADGVLKLIGYLNVFLNALGFKVDLTKNIGKNTKAIKEQTSAQKELNRQTAKFDEMDVMSSNTSSSSSGGGGAGSNAFEMPELNEGIVKTLENLAHILKDNWDWIWKVGAALGIVFGIAKISGLLSNIGALLGGGAGAGATGLLGLTGILKGLLAMEIITITISIITHHIEAQEVVNDLKNIRQGKEKINEETKKLNDAELKYYKETGKQQNEHISNQQQIKQQIRMTKDEINKTTKDIERDSGTLGGVIQNTIDTFLGIFTNEDSILMEHHKHLDDEKQQLADLKVAYFNLYISGQITFDELKEEVPEFNALLDSSGYFTQLLTKKVDNLADSGKKMTDVVNAQLDKTKEKLNNLNNTKASMTVELKADTKKLSNTFESLASSFGGAFGTPFKNIANKLRTLGLARGGIVNLPGRGVSLTNAVVGEATGGTEGIVPLNNEQSMDLIGQSIARHININLTNNTMLDGKVISREQKIINDNTNFATNGRGV